jgi:hypothetical protein
VNGDVATLYEAVGQVDAPPTTSQMESITKTENRLASVMQRWTDLKTVDLPALNEKLKSTGGGELRPEIRSSAEEDRGDEE